MILHRGLHMRIERIRNGNASSQGTPSIRPKLSVHDFSARYRPLTTEMTQAAATESVIEIERIRIASVYPAKSRC
jgi:hypothetical protein